MQFYHFSKLSYAVIILGFYRHTIGTQQGHLYNSCSVSNQIGNCAKTLQLRKIINNGCAHLLSSKVVAGIFRQTFTI